ncbi:MbcA/ParS/Xre antitoxin family protein [Motiliproteus sp. SC1-56]|uniref:MbcA/ParS/Xre antitoxin family protein n=1 Tax=Motiliproteus sp. SC1-56 TaxID=2799565 RepID=UPI001A8D7EED|nr:MbcA/ParS/Xre antitoxin family protein [Motiliproteus sp. SC1-56]
MSAQAQPRPDPAHVLAKALFNAAEQMGLNMTEVGKVIGLHRTSMGRLRKSMLLDPASKEGELALLLIRAARALYALSGGDSAWISHFMRNRNQVTGGVPAEQVQSVTGLTRVVTFLDAIRGKV